MRNPVKIIIASFLGTVLLSSMNACVSPTAISIEDTKEPPLATLEINGKSQDARVGSYCWSTKDELDEPVEACQDSVGVPTVFAPLVASSPVTAQLHFAMKEPPDQISASVFVASKAYEFEVPVGDLHIWSYKEGTLVTLQPRSNQELTLELDPGLYVFNVFCVWENKGESSYGFFIEVK